MKIKEFGMKRTPNSCFRFARDNEKESPTCSRRNVDNGSTFSAFVFAHVVHCNVCQVYNCSLMNVENVEMTEVNSIEKNTSSIEAIIIISLSRSAKLIIYWYFEGCSPFLSFKQTPRLQEDFL